MTGRPKGAPKTGGRRKGTPNKTTSILKDAIIEAAEKVGQDRKGKNGLVGYCQRLAEQEPKAFATLMGKVLPVQVTGNNGERLVPRTIKIVGVAPSDGS